MILAQHARHLGLLNPGQRTIGYRRRCRHPQPLTREASFAEEVTLAQNRDDRFLALFGGHSEFHLAFPEVEQRSPQILLARRCCGSHHTQFWIAR